MRRVVITGLGAVSSIGNNREEVLASLQMERSGLARAPEMAELGFKCSVFAPVKQLDMSFIAKGARRTMSRVACYAVLAALEALQDARLPLKALGHQQEGIVIGSAFGGIYDATELERLLAEGVNHSRAG